MIRDILETIKESARGLGLIEHKLKLILANLETIREMPLDALVPFDLVNDLIRMVKELQA